LREARVNRALKLHGYLPFTREQDTQIMSVMTAVTNVGKEHAELYKTAILQSKQAEAAAQEAGLSTLLIELVKIRTSQINGCTYCMRLHTGDAIKYGESIDRLAVLSSWRETQYFTEEEQAALNLAEFVTGISNSHAHRDLYADAAAVLTPEQLSAITWMTISVNALNRVAITSSYPVKPKA
jgi:AhpD family alkylhydroperoxidase